MDSNEVPLRVDFAGGWLDVPRFARRGGFIVNCAISPLVSMERWNYKRMSGLGGSAASALLRGKDPVASDLKIAGWQDGAVIKEMGLCVWRSGELPELSHRDDGSRLLSGRMALFWTGKHHSTAEIVDLPRNYEEIEHAGWLAKNAVLDKNIRALGAAVRASYHCQLEEGMEPLKATPAGAIARKYCGSGWGGYSLHLFEDPTFRDEWVRMEPNAISVEPYART